MTNRVIATSGLALALLTPGMAADLDWQFYTAKANNIAPVVGSSATADIITGPLSAGWSNPSTYQSWNLGSPVAGTAAGYWDLGKSGSISLRGLGSRDYELKIVEWSDPVFGLVKVNGSIGTENQQFTSPSNRNEGSMLNEGEPSAFGQWKQYIWNIPAGCDSLTICSPAVASGAGAGAIVGRIEVSFVPEPYHYGLVSLLGMAGLAVREAVKRQKRLAHTRAVGA